METDNKKYKPAVKVYRTSRKPAWKKESKPYESRIGPLEVVVRDNDVVGALRILKNKMSKEGVLGELKRRRFAEKPSERKDVSIEKH